MGDALEAGSRSRSRWRFVIVLGLTERVLRARLLFTSALVLASVLALVLALVLVLGTALLPSNEADVLDAIRVNDLRRLRRRLLLKERRVVLNGLFDKPTAVPKAEAKSVFEKGESSDTGETPLPC